MERKIVFSFTEPNKTHLWLHRIDGKLTLQHYGPAGWETVAPDALKTKLNIEDPDEVKKYINRMSLNEVHSVEFTGTVDGTLYDTTGYYYNGYFSVLQGHEVIVFNIDFNTGEVTLHTEADFDKFLDVAYLEIGDSDEIKALNKERLKAGHQFCSLDYGFGVATYQPATGGFAHVTTAYGDEVFYTITEDGAIAKDEDYIKPDEPYAVVLTADQIGSPLEENLAGRVYIAGMLKVIGSTGLVTYLRTSDSTESASYFTSAKKDGTVSLLTYTLSNKTITASTINGPAGSPYEYYVAAGGMIPEDEFKTKYVNLFNDN